jgi:hypothetical protein
MSEATFGELALILWLVGPACPVLAAAFLIALEVPWRKIATSTAAAFRRSTKTTPRRTSRFTVSGAKHTSGA